MSNRLSPRKSPRQARSKATVAAILQAAAQVLVHGGVGAVTTNVVAERAGVSIGSLYQYFPSKEAIFAELIYRMRQEMLADLDAVLSGAKNLPLQEAAAQLVVASMRHHTRNPKLADLLEVLEAGLPLHQETAAIKTLINLKLAAFLHGFEIAEPELAAQDLRAMCHGMVDAAVRAGEQDFEALAARVTRAVLGYLRCA